MSRAYNTPHQLDCVRHERTHARTYVVIVVYSFFSVLSTIHRNPVQDIRSIRVCVYSSLIVRFGSRDQCTARTVLDCPKNISNIQTSSSQSNNKSKPKKTRNHIKKCLTTSSLFSVLKRVVLFSSNNPSKSQLLAWNSCWFPRREVAQKYQLLSAVSLQRILTRTRSDPTEVRLVKPQKGRTPKPLPANHPRDSPENCCTYLLVLALYSRVTLVCVILK